MAFGKKRLILTGIGALAAVCMGGIIGYQAFRSGKSLQQDGYVNWVNDTGEYERSVLDPEQVTNICILTRYL